MQHKQKKLKLNKDQIVMRGALKANAYQLMTKL